MFFGLTNIEDKQLKSDYSKMLSDLNEFYGINWVDNLPKVFLVDSREQIDLICGYKTERWVVGWVEHTNVYVLRNEMMDKESTHKKYSDIEYSQLIKHEISHCFFKILSDFCPWVPKWLWEGVAIYSSGQNLFNTRVTGFKDFLSFYDQESAAGVYREAGFAVGVLVSKFGKERLMSLIKNLKRYQSKESFENAFKAEYGFVPNYDSFNGLLLDQGKK
jgi:hypothetical protein